MRIKMECQQQQQLMMIPQSNSHLHQMNSQQQQPRQYSMSQPANSQQQFVQQSATICHQQQHFKEQQRPMQTIVSSALNNSGGEQVSGAAYTTTSQQQQQVQLVLAPPTPPSDAESGSVFVGPPQTNCQLQSSNTHHHHHQQHQQQQTRWIVHPSNQPPITHQRHSSHSHSSLSNSHEQHQQQHQQHQQSVYSHHQHHHSHSQQQTIPQSYYYDIDDEFSDILSAPPTPEPGAHLHGQLYQHQSQQQAATTDMQQQQDSSYPNYHQLPFNTSQQQQQPQLMPALSNHCNYLDSVPHYAMSPDSSALSTSSSSPSDHSLYQPSPLSNHQQQHSSSSSSSQVHAQALSPVSLSHYQHELRPASQQAPLVQAQQATTILQPTGLQRNSGQQQQHRSSPIHLWEFLKELLQQVDAASGESDTSVIRWIDKQRGIFKIEDSVRVARLWGKRKNKPKMNYDKLSRSIRQYYKKGIMKKTDRSQRLVYQFCSAYCH